jgi:ParB family transcriptional regulator, chromosome partitioning protein
MKSIVVSVREWGKTIPILVDDQGNVIAGHGRLLAARQLQVRQVPVLIAKGWSETQRRAYVLADNRLAESATWDGDLLAVELQELNAAEFDFTLLGFTTDEMDKLMQAGEFAAGSAGESGDLSVLQPIICPHCGGEIPR